jgi:RNA polymerase sigma-70 factor, ECF subfamily
MQTGMAAIGPAQDATSEADLERELVVRAQSGDATACRELIVRHERAVGGLLRRMLAGSGHATLAEDLAQETFLRGFAALGRFDPLGPARLSTWLLTIATRLALQAIARRRLPTQSLDESVIASDFGTHDESPDRARLGRRIELAVSALAPAHRAVFLLREYHGLDYTEIALALAIDLGTVKSRLSRARAALRFALEDVRHG